MSVNKFRFVSPGVFINEIDNSQLPKTPADIGPVIIGRSQRGPSMRPVRVQSFSDFVDVFGEPLAGGQGGDVWREGNKTSPTYAAYAAQAYLRNSNPVTFVRLAGLEHPNKTSGGEAGWATTYAYGLFVMPISASSTNVYTTAVGGATASLAAVIYSNDTNFGLTGKPLSGSTETVSKALGTWVRSTGANLEFKIVVPTVGNPTGELKSVNFDENSKKHIRSVLNCNPIMTNSSITSNTEKYFLGETFKTWVERNNSNNLGSSADTFAAVLVDLQAGSVDFASFKEPADFAATGYIVSQDTNIETGSFSASGSTGEYPSITKLFRLVSLTEGEWNSQKLKISIEDIKEPPNQYVKYGTFTVSVRKIDDTDLTPVYVERFTGLSLDPFSENFIAKKIGDKYTVWDYTKKTFVEYGKYDNKSAFIRVEMNQDVENGYTDPGLLPFGYYGPTLYTASLTGVVSSSNISVGGVTFNNTVITGNQNYTASFALPKIPNLTTTDDFPYPTFSSVYWGFKTNYQTVKKYNNDIPEFLRARPKDYAASRVSYMFSLDDVSGSIVSGAVSPSVAATWAEGNRLAGRSITAQNQTGSDGGRLILSVFNKFNVPLFGGFEGVNITEKDPFNARVLEGKTELNNYAYNSVKVAVESIADPEVVEMNMATMPGIENESLTSLLIDKCETRGDALAVIDLKGDYVPDEAKASATTSAAARKPNVDTVVLNLKNRAMNSSYGCAFFPWVLVKDVLNNNTVWVPPSVAALGTFSNSQRKTELWFAPAGFNRGGLTDGAAGLPVLQTSLRLSSKDRDKLYAANINPIATFPAEGVVVFGQKTLQVTPSALDRINVRRLMIYLKKEISRFASTVLFDPNTQVTWKRFLNLADPFLQSVQSRFGLQEYKIILDETTTTPELVDRNIVYAKILLKPTRAIEFIALDFVITNTGASFND